MSSSADPVEPLIPPGETADGASGNGPANADDVANVHVRLRPITRTRLLRLGTVLGTKSSDETVRILLDLYEVNSGTFAPTDIKDLSALLQQLLVLAAAVNATHMEIVDLVRSEHRGTNAKAKAIAEELGRELARIRAAKFPQA